ncbi:hypothetical protein B0H66DRAFT_604041 [Apodospora peruviana]|uniref:O-methyltransferase C-terminal domain-containing protein n=1 Tax=Apodospora peruviana TaxID=516989 RepID=A0AAE0HZF2_9PEZI|nr:hypothetical protein B0H66DRAFT_604041 [Apodospora peruviana]
MGFAQSANTPFTIVRLKGSETAIVPPGVSLSASRLAKGLDKAGDLVGIDRHGRGSGTQSGGQIRGQGLVAVGVERDGVGHHAEGPPPRRAKCSATTTLDTSPYASMLAEGTPFSSHPGDGLEQAVLVALFEGLAYGARLRTDRTAVAVEIGGNQAYNSHGCCQRVPQLSFIVKDKTGMRTPDPQTEVADAYFLRLVFHCFSDTYCVRILEALVPVLRKGSRILINDSALPEQGTSTMAKERFMRMGDLWLWVLRNAREQEVDEWTQDWTVKVAWKPEKSAQCFIEANGRRRTSR